MAKFPDKVWLAFLAHNLLEVSGIWHDDHKLWTNHLQYWKLNWSVSACYWIGISPTNSRYCPSWGSFFRGGIPLHPPYIQNLQLTAASKLELIFPDHKWFTWTSDVWFRELLPWVRERGLLYYNLWSIKKIIGTESQGMMGMRCPWIKDAGTPQVACWRPKIFWILAVWRRGRSSRLLTWHHADQKKKLQNNFMQWQASCTFRDCK